MRGLNLLYSRLEEASFKEVTPGQIDDLKSRFQAPLGAIAQAASWPFRQRGPAKPRRSADKQVECYRLQQRRDNSHGAERLDREMDDVMELLHQELDLANVDVAVDAIVALSMADEMPNVLHP